VDIGRRRLTGMLNARKFVSKVMHE